eukprot:403375169
MESQDTQNKFNLRVGTYNILNTKDRYTERERLLKKNLYELNADIIGLQEVVFGEKQLDELIHPNSTSSQAPKSLRHEINLEEIGASQRQEGYNPIAHPVQMQIFKARNHPDKNAQLDGNAILLCNSFMQTRGCRILSQDFVHISAFRNAQRVILELPTPIKNENQDLQGGRLGGRRVHLINTHLHHEIPHGLVRKHQAQNILMWIEASLEENDIVIFGGDFNSNKGSETVDFILESGYKSSYLEVNKEEPELTFPTGLQAEFMDTDPPGTLDYIFYKGRGIQPVTSQVMGQKCDEKDSTIYGSDHMPIVTDFVIEL